MNIEDLRAGVERWLQRIWFGEIRGVDKLAAVALAPIALPLSLLTGAIARRRRRAIVRQPPDCAVPVIVVGNLVAGGAGKTPIAIAIAIGLQARGRTVGLIAGGYRGADTAGGAAMLVEATTAAEAVGDEAALLARETALPVAAGRDRAAALQCLLTAHPDIDLVVSDDGLQHRGLARRFEIIVIDERGFGNGWCLPAGPLREPIDRLSTVDLVLLNAAHRTGRSADVSQVTTASTSSAAPTSFQGHPVSQIGTVQPAIHALRSLDGTQRWALGQFVASVGDDPIAAVAGIARPARFFDSLRAAGLEPVSCQSLGDHARLDTQAIERLARIDARWILMTGKDAVKLDHAPPALRARCLVVEHRAMLDDGLLTSIDAALGPPGRRTS